jgi:hypothetical protein
VERPRVGQVERGGADAGRPLRRRRRRLHVDHHAQEAPRRGKPARREQLRRTRLAHEVRRLEARRPLARAAGEGLARAPLAQLEERRADAAAALLRVHVGVGEEPAAVLVVARAVADRLAVGRDQPRVAREIEVVPLVAQALLGPVALAEHGDLRRLEQREHVGQVVPGRRPHGESGVA